MLEQTGLAAIYEDCYELCYREGYLEGILEYIRWRHTKLLGEAKKLGGNSGQASEGGSQEKDNAKSPHRIILSSDPERQDFYDFIEKYPRLDDEKLARKIMEESEYLHMR